MWSKASPERPRAKPEMNVTPLVDVVLVLLIIFMVVTPQLENQVDVPRVERTDPTPPDMPTLTVVVARDGGLALDQERLTTVELEDRLAEAFKRRPESRVVIKGDRAADYGSVRHVFKACQNLGFRGVALTVESPSPEQAATEGG